MKRTVLGIAAVLLIACGLAGACVVATQQGWQPPRWLVFLTKWSQGGSADSGLFCREHGVPEKFCTICHDELKSRLLMCKEHGLPEEICTLCHPESEQKYGLKPLCKQHGLPEQFCSKCMPMLLGVEVESDWCPEHGVPESLCTRCKPALTQTLAMCSEHGVPEALCTICRPELAKNFPICELHQLPAGICPQPNCPTARKLATAAAKKSLPLVRLAGADVATDSGIVAEAVQKAAVAPVIGANGEVSYDETRLAHVRARLAGIVREVSAQVGQSVQEGDVLGVIDSSELGQTKADYLAAAPMVELWTKTLSRNRSLGERQIVAEKQILEAETELQKAKAELIKVGQRLRNFGFDDDTIANLPDEAARQRNLMRITAPLAGTVVRRKAVPGEAVEPTSELFSIADLTQMWVHLDVYEKDLRRIRVGQPVTFRVPGLAPAEFAGKVTWIDTEVNDQTRSIRVRVIVENKSGLLRANMFGKGEIQVGEPHTSLVVPRESVQWEGSSYVVFVEKQPDQFEPRRVLLGSRIDSRWPRTAGSEKIELAWADLKQGERVVTTGSFLLKTEIMKGSIGAGCCGE